MTFDDLTVKDRVLLYLINFSKETLLDVTEMDTDYVVKSLPHDITQEGIAESVGIRWNHASRALKELSGMGLVEIKKANIEGGRRVRFVYFLTPEGYQLAKEVEAVINNKEFKLLREGKLESMTFSQVYRTYGLDMSLFDFFIRFEKIFSNIVTEGDLLDNVSFSTVIDQIGRVHHHIALPTVEILGRENEVGLIQDILNEGPNTITIIGLPGMGKTSLISQILSISQGYETLYYPVHEWDSARSVLVTISHFLEKINKGRLRDYLKASGPEGEVGNIGHFDLWEVHQILSEDLIGEKAIITFDDFQKAGDEVKRLISMIYSIVSEGDDLHLCILSRKNPDFYSQKEVIAEKKVYELHLGGIDYSAMKSLLDRRGIVEQSQYPTIYQITGGHPLAIDLIGSSEGLEGAIDLTTYVRDEVMNKLAPQLRSFLRKVAIYRKPVSIDMITSSEDDIDTLNRLISLSLISETGSKIALHDVIRVVVYDNLPDSLKNDLHLEAANSLIGASIEDLVEAFFHFMYGGSYDKAVKLLEENLLSFIEYGYVREIQEIIESMEVSIDNRWKSHYDVIRLEILLSLGEYQRTQEILGEIESTGIFKDKKFQYKAGMIYGRGSNANKDKTTIQKAEALHWKGKAHTRLGESKKGKVAFEEAIRLAKENNDRILEAKVLMATSFISDENIDYALEAANIFEIEGALYDLAEAKNYVGRLYYRKGDLKSAEENWIQGIEIGKRTGNFRLTAVMQYNLSSVFIERGDFVNALKQLRRSTKTFFDVNFASGFIYSKVGYGSYYTMRGKFDIAERFLNMGEKIARELNDEKALELVFEEKCTLYEKSGDKKQLKECKEQLTALQS